MFFARLEPNESQRTLGAIRRALGRATGAPVDRDDVESREAHIAVELRRQRLDAMALTTFGVLAVALAALGIWAVVAHAVTQRRRELGIRLALGASVRHIIAIVLRDGLVAAVVGLALGTGGALLATQVLRATLVRTDPRDAGVLAASAVVLVLVSLLAAYVPARWAARVSPASTLRGE